MPNIHYPNCSRGYKIEGGGCVKAKVVNNILRNDFVFVSVNGIFLYSQIIKCHFHGFFLIVSISQIAWPVHMQYIIEEFCSRRFETYQYKKSLSLSITNCNITVDLLIVLCVVLCHISGGRPVCTWWAFLSGKQKRPGGGGGSGTFMNLMMLNRASLNNWNVWMIMESWDFH